MHYSAAHLMPFNITIPEIPISADSIFIYGYFLCVAMLAMVFPLSRYARHKKPSINTHRKGLVSTNALNIFDLLGLAIFFCIYAVFLLDYLTPAEVDEKGNPVQVHITPIILAVGIIVQLVPPMLVAVMIRARGVRIRDFLGLDWKHARYLWVITPGGVILAYMFLFFIEYHGYSGWLEEQFGSDAKLQETVKTYQEANAIAVRIMIAISAILIAPVAEEIVFRGYIYTTTKRFSGRLFATLLSSLLFGIVHFNITALIPLIFLAIVLALAYELSGSLWAPISIHALFNASQILFQEVKFH
ncbi:MAG: CPBP family intramembrane metalloprotease [Akkermansiaceae bacterium]|nr:CPBP family intramembrane metalloprotease [Akkermansiaceae bacterium]